MEESQLQECFSEEEWKEVVQRVLQALLYLETHYGQEVVVLRPEMVRVQSADQVRLVDYARLANQTCL